MSRAYYNEIDKYAAQWLTNLILAGHIAPGDVDTRSIEDVTPAELAGYTQCHFFAGIGVWSHALRLAGWPDDRPVWTGSCPCQPFSSAGKGARFADERHLWPAWHHLIREGRPPVVFGEQVASKAGLVWLDLVSADLEASLLTVEYADICAASVGAPHIRQRLYFVAHSMRNRSQVNVALNASERALGQVEGGPPLARIRGSEISNRGCWEDQSRPEPVADGVAASVGRLRAYGNAIVAPLAAEFIAAYMECAP